MTTSADSSTALPVDNDNTAKLAEQLLSNNLKRQLSAVKELTETGESGILILLDFLKAAGEPSAAAGKIYQ